MGAALLAVALGAYGWFLLGDRIRQRFGLFPPAGRIARYRRWLIRSWLWFGATSAMLLWLIGGLGAAIGVPALFVGPALFVRAALGGGWTPLSLVLVILPGLAAGSAVGLFVGWWRARRGRRDWIIGRIDRLMPQAPGEVVWAAALAVSAGVTEELFFRLTLPLLIALVTGNAWAGFGIALLLFAAAHRYQGPAGIAATLALGAVMTGLYLLSGSLLPAMLVHALINLNGLVLRPLVTRRVRRRS